MQVNCNNYHSTCGLEYCVGNVAEVIPPKPIHVSLKELGFIVYDRVTDGKSLAASYTFMIKAVSHCKTYFWVVEWTICAAVRHGFL